MQEESIFIDALEREDPAERAAFLDQACAGHPALRGRIERLLRRHEQADGFLEATADGRAGHVDEPAASERPGSMIGAYKLLEQIGEGGFGVVFMAEQQQPIRRRVALKILKPGMDTKQVIARFEAERQALALMDHPNIAHVFEGGETPPAYAGGSPRPYFVMELVRGIPITEFCDQNQLPVRQRLDLFHSVCQAVHHAHQKGVIHRDLKPSNVLVTLHDDKAVAKVIDFGIAKAMGQQLTDKTLFTQFAQLVGTPLYMSPEQAQLSGLDIDTRSDIYSLGVLLYELLTGTTPFDKEHFQHAAFDEVRRIIREVEPPRPSTRISTLGQAATTVSAQRRSDPKRLKQLFRGELDWIVMKALEKDRNRRYESASAFAADVQRYLHDEPVHACPPSLWYRCRKFARRRKRVVVLAGFLAVLLVTVVALLAVGFAQVTRALDRERHTAYFHLIALAHRELTGNLPDPARAEELLDACPPEWCRWEWHYLKRLWRVEPVVLHDPANEEINSVAYAPDGEHLAAGCGDGTVRVWHIRTGRVVATLRGHGKSVFSVAFSPTESWRLASAGVDRTVRVWNWRTEKEVFPALPGQEGSRHCVAYSVTFSPDGRWLAAASAGGTVRVWDAQTGRLIQELPGHELRAASVAFSRDGRNLLASGSWAGVVRIWDVPTGTCLSTLVGGRPDPISAVAFSPDSRRLAAGHVEHVIDLWDATTGTAVCTLREHSISINGLAFSYDSDRLGSVGEDGTVRVWDLVAQREVLRLRGHTSSCPCLAASPDGRTFASAGLDGTIRLWDATPLTGNERQAIRTFHEHDQEVWSVVISPDGRRIASAGQSGTVVVQDVATGEVIRRISDSMVGVFDLAYSPDGRLAAVGGEASDAPFVLRVWDPETGRTVLPPYRERQEIRAVRFSPDGRFLAIALEDGTVKLVNARTGQETGFEDKCHREGLFGSGIAFRPDGRHLASVGREGTLTVRDLTPAYRSLGSGRAWLLVLGLCPPTGGCGHLPLAAGVQLAVCSETTRPHSMFTRRSSEHPFSSVDYSPDSRRLLTASTDGQLTLWEADTGKEIRAVRGPVAGEHFAGENNAYFTPDGRWIVAVSADCAVRVWDATTLKVIDTFRGHRNSIVSRAVSPDGKFLVTGSDDHTVKVWDLTHLDRQLK
jgi:WD40 repeat protein/serine/threonine protein kinase